MKLNLDFGPQTPREMDGRTIDVVSTSAKTANASPIILKATDMVQSKFEPVLVENEKDEKKSVSGKLVYEKKRKKDEQFPSDKITRQSVKVGEIMEISLGTTETLNLFNGLKELYALYENIGNIPYGGATYTRIDSSFRNFLSIIQKDPSAARMIGTKENYELVKILLQLITQTSSRESLKNALENLHDDNMVQLNNSINIERLNRILESMESNLDNGNEEFWQQTIFKENQWILSQLFACPCTIFESKAYVGGKSVSNAGGNLCDFLYQNSLTKNIALIEIKTPMTDIFAKPYRNSYSFSLDMSGAINQVINYRDNLTKEYYTLLKNGSTDFEALTPKCIVVIGKIGGMNAAQVAAFESYRNSLNNVEIVAYDEIVHRIKDLLSVFLASNEKTLDNCQTDIDEELPF